MTTEPDDYLHQLREAAFAYAEHGWPIAPGVRAVPRRRDGWPLPDRSVFPYQGAMNPNAVGVYWQQRPYAVVVSTGLYGLDVFRLRHPTATTVLERLTGAGHGGPVATLPNGQWLFFVEAGDPPDELLSRTVHYYGAFQWVPLPPTRIGRQAVIWHIEPASVGWRLFPRQRFRDALRAVRPARRRRRMDAQTLESATPRPPFTLIIGGDSAPALRLIRNDDGQEYR